MHIQGSSIEDFQNQTKYVLACNGNNMKNILLRQIMFESVDFFD